MKEIPLTKGHVALVDDRDFELVSRYKWYAFEAYKGKVYASSREGWAALLMHRVILNAPKGVPVDHKDGNGLNNQRSNIRLVTWSENQFNRGRPRWKEGSSEFKGVHWYELTKQWEAKICANGRRVHIGYFDNARDAAIAYNAAAKCLHGRFAFQNALSGA